MTAERIAAEQTADSSRIENHCPACEVLRQRTERHIPLAELSDMAELFKIFGDQTRIRILYALFEHETSVGEIAEALSMTQSAISHQLRILKQADLIRSRREGKAVYYSLADEHVKIIIAMGRDHIEEKRGEKA